MRALLRGLDWTIVVKKMKMGAKVMVVVITRLAKPATKPLLSVLGANGLPSGPTVHKYTQDK